MLRRDLLAGLLATTIGTSLRAAEPNRVYLVAVCDDMATDPISKFAWSGFFDRLRQLGYIEGKNVKVDRFASDGKAERYGEIARNMVQANPDVIAFPLNHQ